MSLCTGICRSPALYSRAPCSSSSSAQVEGFASSNSVKFSPRLNRLNGASLSGRDCQGRVGRVSEVFKSYQKFRVHCEGGGEARGALSVEEWTRKLPAKRKALYSHSLPCIEAWLQSLGFYQGKEDRSVWNIERSDWHAQLSLDVTDLHIRYLKTGPGNLERDIERKFSYALSREDLENAILGGP